MTNVGLFIDLPPEKQSEVRISSVLPGRVISEAPVNRNAVYRVLAKVWANKLDFQRWEPNCSLSDIDFSLASFWVQAHGLNLDQLTYNNALVAGRSMGVLETAENPVINNVLGRAFLRFTVQIDVTKPLAAGFWSNGKWIDLKYERLSDYCCKCGRLGHSEREEKVMSLVDLKKPMYGDWLRTARVSDKERDYGGVSNEVKSADSSNVWSACSHALKHREKSQGGRGGSSYIIPARRKGDLSSDVSPSVPVSPTDLVQERPMEQGGACNLNLGIGAANALPNGLADRSGYEDSVYFVEIPEDEEERKQGMPKNSSKNKKTKTSSGSTEKDDCYYS
ncbi:hypothetical protein SLEP1_g13930 [Rubroshorea leprosula]|uniref:Zinc knuckle CX2CX4HX4C domain-containing protein n=1 Tax=Rubroshorea leprosula TaxID=152421 RepID=A0AAV5ITZ1_9ROSI|nr:hypothetical protein SLEP1_g13930 [Rubroshorea leprosula]